jgi:hypothetical protein
MPDVPNWLAGSVTVAVLVGCGIFLYPWMLKRRGGAAAVAAITVAVALLYFLFDRGSGSAALSATLALVWALAPVLAGVIVHRLQRR